MTSRVIVPFMLAFCILFPGCKKERPRNPLTNRVIYSGCRDLCEDLTDRKKECRAEISALNKEAEFPETMAKARMSTDVTACVVTCEQRGEARFHKIEDSLAQKLCSEFAKGSL